MKKIWESYKKIVVYMAIFLFVDLLLFSEEEISYLGEEDSSVENSILEIYENKMENYNKKKREEWKIHPFDRKESDRYFSSWTDPLAYTSGWYMHASPKAFEYYDEKKFKLDKVLFYHAPQLGGSLSPIAFSFDDNKYRFLIGVGFLWGGSFAMYGNGGTQLYGTNLYLNSFLQVEPFIDFIYKDNLKIRLTPIRHVCYHISGDILGDPSLHVLEGYQKEGEKADPFKDVGFEQIHASINYHLGWFNFYGGLAVAVTHFYQNSYLNVLNFYGGTDARIPVWGELCVIVGLHLGGNYDKICSIKRNVQDNSYKCVDYRYEMTPVISAGIGFGIRDWILGLKFDYARSRQLYAVEHMEPRIGMMATLLMY